MLAAGPNANPSFTLKRREAIGVEPHSPEMALGESRDADNNTIPDQSVITNPETYVGEFQFSSNSSMQEWLDGMRMMGTPVTGPGGEQQQELRIFCRWVGDGTEFRCDYF
jgi:hypothetical protein